MFSVIKEFIRRHRNKIIVAGIVFGSAIVGSRYVKQRFIEWQERETKDFLERKRKQHYFESTEKTCNQTIVFLSTSLRENVIKLVDCEQVIKSLREGSSNKVELWQELKDLVFTKVTLLIYSGTLLVIALRIQLNIIGGHIYCKTLMHENNSKATNDLQEKYLSQCHYFLNEGIKELLPLIQEKVKLYLKDIPLKQNMTLQQIENICWAIQTSINNDLRNPLRRMPLLLYGCNLQDDDILIKEMMLDTVDLMQSPEVLDLASTCINRGFSDLIDRISEFFLPEKNNIPLCEFPSTSGEFGTNVTFSHPNNLSKPFAKLIPIINSFGNSEISHDSPEAWISPFIYMDKVKLLGANIYESYSYPKN